MLGDLKNPRLIILKGFLFLLGGLIAVAILLGASCAAAHAADAWRDKVTAFAAENRPGLRFAKCFSAPHFPAWFATGRRLRFPVAKTSME